MALIQFTCTYCTSPFVQWQDAPKPNEDEFENMLPSDLLQRVHSWSEEFNSWTTDDGFVATGETRARLDREFDHLGDEIEALGYPLERTPWWR